VRSPYDVYMYVYVYVHVCVCVKWWYSVIAGLSSTFYGTTRKKPQAGETITTG